MEGDQLQGEVQERTKDSGYALRINPPKTCTKDVVATTSKEFDDNLRQRRYRVRKTSRTTSLTTHSKKRKRSSVDLCSTQSFQRTAPSSKTSQQQRGMPEQLDDLSLDQLSIHSYHSGHSEPKRRAKGGTRCARAETPFTSPASSHTLDYGNTHAEIVFAESLLSMRSPRQSYLPELSISPFDADSLYRMAMGSLTCEDSWTEIMASTSLAVHERHSESHTDHGDDSVHTRWLEDVFQESEESLWRGDRSTL